MQKLYCYVDESGQDTEGRLFLVSIVITGSERDELEKRLREIEKESRKNVRKWTRATRAERIAYMKRIVEDKIFSGTMYYSYYPDTKSYVDLTIYSTAKAINQETQKSPYHAVVYVDGLRGKEEHRFGAGLRKLGIKVRKVRGMRDESNEFIRLADALAGFVRDSIEGDKYMKNLYDRAVRRKVIKEV